MACLLTVCTPALSCDLEALRHYPMTKALENRAVPLRMPDLFFKSDERRDFDRFSLDAAGAAELRAALARGLATFQPVERPVLMLAALDHWTSGGAGLKGFFVLSDSVFLEEALQALDTEGLTGQAALLREGAALFGPDYGGTQAQRYARWSDGHGEIRDPALDAALDRLSERFHALPPLLDAAAARIARSPDLAALYEPLRSGAGDDDRLAYLTGGLWTCLNHYDAPASVAGRLAALPEAHGRIIVVRIFEAEMLNGSVHQAFFNSSGVLAPDVAAALKAMNLPEHAAAVERGIAMFPTPYPRDTEKRRAFMGTQNEAFDTRLENLTGAVDDGAMHEAMIATARAADILPK
ncbi:DMP19 family protein [Methylobacterium sp. J-043]|nr:DMP19 family protein [Methylobacterium sp. J-043]